MVLGIKKIRSHKEVSHTSQIISQSYRNMASESMMSEAITKAVAEATKSSTTDNDGDSGTKNTECNRAQTRWSHLKVANIQLGSAR